MRWQAVLVVLVVLAACGAAAAGGQDANKKALQELQGEWKIEKAEAGGKAAPEEKVAKTRVLIAKDKLTFEREEKKEEVTIALDAGKTPHEINITPGGEAKKVQGIYKLDGDALTIAFIRGGEGRPKEFASPEKSKVSILHLRRVKK